MAKSKKNVGAFQKAMLSNTKMIRSEESRIEDSETANKAKVMDKQKVKDPGIDPIIQKKLEEMGKKYDLDTSVLIEKGLDLFVSLEDYWFTDKK